MDPQRHPRLPVGNSSARPTQAPSRGPARPGQAVHPVRRRRPSRRTFLIRRLIALGVVVAVVVGLVSVVKSAFGEDESQASSVGEPNASVAVDQSSSTVASSAPAESTVAAASTASVPATPVDTNRTPTAGDPARVLLVGDSEAGGLSPFLSTVLDATGVTKLSTDYKVSSGLVRPDFYDWPAHLRETVPAVAPDVVVALFGGNDGQSFLGSDATAGAAAGKAVDTPEWRAEYGRRVGEVMDFLSADGRTLVWVGVPNAEDERLTASLNVQNQVVKEQIASHPNVLFVDSWYHFTGIDGSFAPLIMDPRDSEFKPVRSETDGFHLNTVGEEILAYYVGQAVTTDLRARGAAL